MLPQRYAEIDIRRAVDPDFETHRDIVFRPRGNHWVAKLEGMRKTAEALLDAASSESSAGERFSYAPMPILRDHRKTAQE
jgi:hypothetical protein